MFSLPDGNSWEAALSGEGALPAKSGATGGDKCWRAGTGAGAVSQTTCSRPRGSDTDVRGTAAFLPPHFGGDPISEEAPVKVATLPV